MTPEAIYRCLDLMREELERQRKTIEQHDQRWANLHRMLANQRNAAIMDLGGLENFLGYDRTIRPKRDKVLGEKS